LRGGNFGFGFGKIVPVIMIFSSGGQWFGPARVRHNVE
jgi:hypothetical protein